MIAPALFPDRFDPRPRFLVGHFFPETCEKIFGAGERPERMSWVTEPRLGSVPEENAIRQSHRLEQSCGQLADHSMRRSQGLIDIRPVIQCHTFACRPVQGCGT